jgi:hypothetical protein
MADSGMEIVSVPVRRAPKHKPLYHLLFGTRRQHGLWAFGDSVAWATQAWWSTLDMQMTEEDPYPRLFPVTQVDRPSIETVGARAVPEVAGNLEDLLRGAAIVSGRRPHPSSLRGVLWSGARAGGP